MKFLQGRTLLTSRNYRLVWAGTLVGAVALALGQGAAFWQIERLTGSALAALAAVASSWVLALLLGVWGGHQADRFDKRRLVIAANVAAALPGLALAATIALDAAEWWMVVAFIVLRFGIRSVFESSARKVLIAEVVDPRRVDKSRLHSGSAFATFAEYLGLGSGGVLAGLVIAQVGVAECLVLDAAACLVTAIVLISVDRRRMGVDRPSEDRGNRRSLMRHVRAERALWGPLACLAPIAAVMLVVPGLLPSLAIETGSGVGAYGWLRGASSVGLTVGALTTWAMGPRHWLLGGAVLGMGAGAVTVGVGIPGALVADVIAIGVLTTAWGTFQTAVEARLIAVAKPELAGALMGLYRRVLAGSSICGTVFLGALTDTWTARAVLGGCGIAFVVAAVPAATWGVRASRRCRDSS